MNLGAKRAKLGKKIKELRRQNSFSLANLNPRRNPGKTGNKPEKIHQPVIIL
jgi:hypothetical protein